MTLCSCLGLLFVPGFWRGAAPQNKQGKAPAPEACACLVTGLQVNLGKQT